MLITLQEAAAATAGTIVAEGGKPAIRQVSTDTRSLAAGDCFVAIKGESFDGHNFAGDAVAKGASCLVLSESPQKPFASQVATLVVHDTTRALGDLALAWRDKLPELSVTAIVGSSGKTTIKEMVATIILAEKPGLATKANLNNLIGVPQMIFQLESSHQVAILELGMNVAGELGRLVGIARPHVLVLANILNAHIGNFGSEAKLYEAKTESLRALEPGATLICNADDPLSIRAREEFGGSRNTITFGIGNTADVRAENIEALEPFGFQFELRVPDSTKSTKVSLRVFGRHNVYNALAASATAHSHGISSEIISARLSDFRTGLNRSEVEQVGGVWIIKDYYNASPAAMEQALASLAEMKISGKRYALLGDMLELGAFEEGFHRRAGEAAASANLAFLATLGKRATTIYGVAVSHGVAAQHFRDAETAAMHLYKLLRPGDVLLIKASRMMKLENVYNHLKQLAASRGWN